MKRKDDRDCTYDETLEIILRNIGIVCCLDQAMKLQFAAHVRDISFFSLL
jgi:hypothetical protein